MDAFKNDRRALKEFGILMGGVSLITSLIVYFKHGVISGQGLFLTVIFLFAGFFAPLSLRLAHRLWMHLAFCLGWINTRILVTLIFYAVFVPLGLCIRLFKVDLLDLKIEKKAPTYWRKKDTAVFSREKLERLF